MLKSIRLRNWRSLRDVSVENLTPITVLIGSNSAGKTNLIDALYFLRECTLEGTFQPIQRRGGMEKIHTVGVSSDEQTEVEIESTMGSYMVGLDGQNAISDVAEQLHDPTGTLLMRANRGGGVEVKSETADRLVPFPDPPFGWEQTLLSELQHRPVFKDIYHYITQRWQLLDEGFMPSLSLASRIYGDTQIVDPCGDNLPVMLDFMQKVNPEIYADLLEDIRWTFAHISGLVTESDEHEIRMAISERVFGGKEAPTISAGTARLVTVLTSVYALDVSRYRQLPGLVVVEEPDTALNPGLLRRFVELLRDYVARDEARQFILTTHNPTFLNLFKPEEVRVVERDKNGDTAVERVPDHITQTWLDEYGLGEVWLTNSFGGVAE